MEVHIYRRPLPIWSSIGNSFYSFPGKQIKLSKGRLCINDLSHCWTKASSNPSSLFTAPRRTSPRGIGPSGLATCIWTSLYDGISLCCSYVPFMRLMWANEFQPNSLVSDIYNTHFGTQFSILVCDLLRQNIYDVI